MPQFLLKRIQALKQYTNYEIFVFEFRRYATQFIVQREQIRKQNDVRLEYQMRIHDEEIQGNVKPSGQYLYANTP